MRGPSSEGAQGSNYLGLEPGGLWAAYIQHGNPSEVETMNDGKDTEPASFGEIVSRLAPLLEELKNGPGYHGPTLRRLPRKGVYVFYEQGKPMYVGRVGDNSKQTIRQRVRQHTIPSSGHNQATFAFRLLQEHLGITAGHGSDLTRPELAERYDAEFREQKQRVGDMEVRAVEVADPMTQAVFEIYVSFTLGTTRYNRFDTH